jgi:hypothetical protein
MRLCPIRSYRTQHDRLFGEKLDQTMSTRLNSRCGWWRTPIAGGIRGKSPAEQLAVLYRALKLVGRNPIEVSYLTNRHPVFEPGSNACEIGFRNRTRGLHIDSYRSFAQVIATSRRRDHRKDTRFTRDLTSRTGGRCRRLDHRRFRCEKSLRRLSHASNPFAIIGGNVEGVFLATQDSLRTVFLCGISKGRHACQLSCLCHLKSSEARFSMCESCLSV